MELEQFEHKDMKFSKDGQLDELIALDRYTIPTYDNYNVGDTVIAIVDKAMGTKKVAEIEKINGDEYTIKDRFGETHTVFKESMHKPLETEPYQLWERWAKGAASVEKTDELKQKWENEFRWLFDGYRYSLGGRIQLMLGQEFVTGKKADLTAYNCFVIRSPRAKDKPVEQFLDVVDVAFYEASIMRRGGGCGLNISYINTVKGSNSTKQSFKFLLEEGHKDSQELQDRIKLGKFDCVEIFTDKKLWKAALEKEKDHGHKVHTIKAGDSVDELFDGLKTMVKQSYEENIMGIDFTELRHRDAIVKGVNGRSSGAVSWMELFVLIAKLLQQDTIDNVEFAEIFSDIVHLIIQGGSRRGALMLICEDDNPNIYKFMERKKAMGYLSGANISVGISDTFMERVKRAKKDLKEMVIPNEEDQKALNLWNVLIESAWSSAEPGIVWMERYNKESNSWYFSEIVATNPCFTGDMKLLTPDGYKTFKELSTQDEVYVINKDGLKSKSKVWCSGEKEILEVRFGNGNKITCTPDHVFMTNDGDEVEANDLKGKRIMPYLKEIEDIDLEYSLLGFIQGDGQLSRLNSEHHKGIEVNVGQGDLEIRHLFRQNYHITEYSNDRTIYLNGLNNKLINLGFDAKILPERVLPSTYSSWNIIQKRSFLRGCYSANGSVLNAGRVTYKTTCKEFAEQLVDALDKDFNIKAYYTTNKPKDVTFSNGTYTCKESYDVCIANFEGMSKFYNEIGFIHRYKMFKLHTMLIEKSPKVTNVVKLNKTEKVYDFTEPLTHWGVVEGVVVHNCGEQGLPEFGVCNLGHFVLSRFFDKENNDVLWGDLERALRIAVRLQDNMIDYTKYFLEENKKVQLNERRVGIGSLGLGTLMIQLGLRYGSDKGNEFVDKLYKFIAEKAYEASMDNAKEKGTFPEYEYEKFIKSGFMKKLLAEFPHLHKKLKETGIRNVTLLTQAPTGSTGTYIDNIPKFRKEFGGTTTGIEPYFSWEYWRAGRLGITKQTVDLAKEYMDKHGLTDVKELPDYFVTAMDLQPSDHVKVQAAVQKWTDSSISKTANCPRDYTIEQTDELYMMSYDLGLKGMTIYRDGSREAQVLATNEEDAKLESHIEAEKLKELKEHKKEVKLEVKYDPSMLIKKRPKRLYGFTDKVGFSYGDKFGRAYVTINLNDGIPWEVFISTKEKEVSGLAKALGLMTTKLLRLGGTSDNLQQAIDTLTYDQTMGTLPSAVANILKQIQKEKMEIDIKKGEKKFELQPCPHCGEKAYDKGNCICHACGVSKCN
jgi:ribonucleoside-diphosphate reductase alpha chain